MAPSAYNNVMQLFQTEDHVVIFNEMVHDARIVQLGRRPASAAAHAAVARRLARLLGWGYAGRRDGQLHGKTSYRGSTDSLHLTERFTRADAGTLLYEFTISEPRTFTQPWTAVVPMKMSEHPIYEYACHEGNYGMEGILAGHREEEREAAAGAR